MSIQYPRPGLHGLKLRRVVFRLHWIAGLAAGLVLAVVGATGAVIGFEKEILGLLNPQYRIDAQGRKPLSADSWIARAQAQQPGLRPRSLAWSSEGAAVRVSLARGSERAVEVAVDPYSGAVLEPQRGADFLHFAESLHRQLAAGPVGKQIVGACTVLLILMLLTGVYLRWPKRWRSLSTWLKPDLRLKSRGFLINLHAVLGTWLLASYLLASLTGLWWSYDFVRDAVNRAAGVTGPLRRPPALFNSDAATLAVEPIWIAFRNLVPDATRARMSLPVQAGLPVEISYQDPESAHERAWNTIGFDAAKAEMTEQKAYADQPRGRRFVFALFPLHSGSYFGMPGRVITALGALLMPFFTITGIWIWLLRRRQESARRVRTPVTRESNVRATPIATDESRSQFLPAHQHSTQNN